MQRPAVPRPTLLPPHLARAPVTAPGPSLARLEVPLRDEEFMAAVGNNNLNTDS